VNISNIQGAPSCNPVVLTEGELPSPHTPTTKKHALLIKNPSFPCNSVNLVCMTLSQSHLGEGSFSFFCVLKRIEHLSSLLVLNLDENHFKEIPSSLALSRSLEHLSLRNNQLTIPLCDSIAFENSPEYAAYEVDCVSGGFLEDPLSKPFRHSPSPLPPHLRYLNLEGNRYTHLPLFLRNHDALETLILSQNPLQFIWDYVPSLFHLNKKMQTLTLQDVRIKSPCIPLEFYESWRHKQNTNIRVCGVECWENSLRKFTITRNAWKAQNQSSQQNSVIVFSSASNTASEWHAEGVYSTEKDSQTVQTQFDDWYNKTAYRIAGMLKEMPPGKICLRTLLSLIGAKRRAIAKKLKSYKVDQYGVFRNQGTEIGCVRNTPLRAAGRYKKYQSIFVEQLQQLGPLSWLGLTRKGVVPGTAIEWDLSCLSFQSGGVIALEHTPLADENSWENLSIVLGDLEEVIQEILHRDLDLEALLPKLAHIHWWLAHIMLFERGSASISELLIHGIALAKGVSLSLKEPGCLLDLEAIACETEQDFIQRYPDMWDTKILS